MSFKKLVHFISVILIEVGPRAARISFELFSAQRVSSDGLSFASDSAVGIFSPLFLFLKINFIGHFKQSAFGNNDLLSCFSVFRFINVGFGSLLIISFLLFALGLS